MKPIAHIYAKDNGTFDIASSVRPRDLVQILLALASAVIKQLDESSNVTLTDAGPDQPPTVEVHGGEIGPGDRVEGIDAPNGVTVHDAPNFCRACGRRTARWLGDGCYVPLIDLNQAPADVMSEAADHRAECGRLATVRDDTPAETKPNPFFIPVDNGDATPV